VAESSDIEWTNATWNPVAGCSLASPGCTNCYAMRMAARLEAMGIPLYQGLTKPGKGGAVWTGEIRQAEPDQRFQPLRWRKPRNIFVDSMSDLFHADVPDAWIDKVFSIMEQCPQHTFQVLTKRPGRVRAYLSDKRVLPNVMIGASVEDHARLDRLADLAATPAAFRFLSMEPLLGDLGRIPLEGIGWAIAGAESGPRARPMDLDWVRSIRDQCAAAGVLFMFKQRVVNGRKISLPMLDGQQHAAVPSLSR